MRLFLKIAIVFFLTLAILIPLMLVHGTITERASYRQTAIQDVAGSYAGEQALTGPVLVVTSQTVEATSSAGAVATFAPTAVDLVDGAVAVSCDAGSGDVFPFGPTTVGCTASDAAGNVTLSPSITVTVQ